MSFTRLSTASFLAMSSAKLENYSVQAKKLREMAFKSKKRVPPWQKFPSLSSRTRKSESLDLRLVSDSDSVSLYMVRQVSVSDSDSNFSSLLVSSLESDHFGGLLF